jgi:hypothetical protein
MNVIVAILLGIVMCILSFKKINQLFVDQTILSLFIISTIIALYFAVVMRDTKYIKKHLTRFILETLLIGIVTVILFVCIYHLRNIVIELPDYLNFVAVGLFFMFIHVLFELCGLYHKL